MMYHAHKARAAIRVRINNEIRAKEVRVLGNQDENIGVLPLKEAIALAATQGFDLVEISPNANPPVAKITDYGKYQYDLNKKKKEWSGKDKEKGKIDGMKQIQIKPTTQGNMLDMRVRMVSEWLNEGYKVHIDLFLSGRYKAIDEHFLKNKFEIFLNMLSTEYTYIEEIRKSPKGFSAVIQKKK
ncbi:MAG: translation initiation factor IF-3 [Alphaproteobacteria bacterium]|nr:translation initiation factor IF-3 [Alphaproteobacteria bacterium]